MGDYIISISHPHRDLILKALSGFEWSSLLEVGCASGPNLKLIAQQFPDKVLFGIDINKEAVQAARDFLRGGAGVDMGDIHNLDFPPKYVDVILADAALMYVHPKDITSVMDDLAQVARKAIIVVDRYAKSKLGVETGHVWGRDYEVLLAERGFLVSPKKLNKVDWPTSPNWAKFGWLFTAVRP